MLIDTCLIVSIRIQALNSNELWRHFPSKLELHRLTVTVATMVSPFQFSDTGVSVIEGNACSIGFRLSRRGQFFSKCTDIQLSRSYLCPFKPDTYCPHSRNKWANTYNLIYVEGTPLSQTVITGHPSQKQFPSPASPLQNTPGPE